MKKVAPRNRTPAFHRPWVVPQRYEKLDTTVYLFRAPTCLPTPRVFLRQEWNPQNLLLTLLAQTAAAPFIPITWPAPSQALAKPSNLNPNLLLTLLPTTLAPFKPVNLAPGLSPSPARPVDLVQNLLLTLLAPVAAVAPFTNVTWASVSPTYPRSQEVSPNLLLTLLPTTAAPFIPTEWVAASRKPQPAREEYPNLQNTLFAPAVTTPFVSTDWSPSSRYRQAPGTEFAQNLALTLLPTTAAPFTSHDWTPTSPLYRGHALLDVEQNNISLRSFVPAVNNRLFMDVETSHLFLRLTPTGHLILKLD